MTIEHPDDTMMERWLAGLKRSWLTFVLAVVLSSIEMERTHTSYTDPPPIVLNLASRDPRVRRLRPYRAHYRVSSISGGILATLLQLA